METEICVVVCKTWIWDCVYVCYSEGVKILKRFSVFIVVSVLSLMKEAIVDIE